MTDKQYKELLEFEHQQGLFAPANAKANDLAHGLKHKEKVFFYESKSRDIAFHRAYFGLLNYCHSWMPANFKRQVPEKHFYNWLKMMQGSYDVIYEFKDGKQLVEYQSISFGRMSQDTFKAFVKLQLPYIYEVFQTLYDEEKANEIINNIEETFEKFLNNL